jgi:hypothetical protein
MSDINDNDNNNFLKDTTNSNKEDTLLIKRRKSDSNLLKTNDTHQHLKTQAQTNRKRNSQMAHQVNKSISSTLAERQLSRLRKDDAPQEDTFYRALEIKFHHSVGSMSISPACRDVVLAG